MMVCSTSFRVKVLAVALAAAWAGAALANPVSPVVAAGQATFQQVGKTLTVTNTPGTIINWQSFSIDRGELTRFVQQSVTSQVVNRVVGVDPSVILGSLQSNGRVILINPNGVAFGVGAQVDVGGLMVSTLQLKDADALAGKYLFNDTPGAGSIKNEGTIKTATGGFVILVAPKVENSGLIHSPEGQILLAAGKSVTIADPEKPSIKVEITNSEQQAVNLGTLIGKEVSLYGGLVRNRGTIQAVTAVRGENGKIRLQARNTVENTGTLQASGAQGGDILIQAQTGSALVQGVVEARGIASRSEIEAALVSTPAATETGKGGRIEILAPTIRVDASIDASGLVGAGAILIGGAYQGGAAAVPESWSQNAALARASLSLSDPYAASPSVTETAATTSTGSPAEPLPASGGSSQNAPVVPTPALPRATTATIAASARIRADALDQGDGGVIVVWSDGTTTAPGHFSALGAGTGNGGLLETSGHHVVLEGIRINLSAVAGRAGTWLIDPTDFTIAASGGDLTGAALSAALGSASVEILSSSGAGSGSGDINVNDAVSWSANQLTLTAAHNININAVMTASGTSSLVLNPATANGNDSAADTGAVLVGIDATGAFTGRVDFGGRSGSGFLTIDGNNYTVINAPGAATDSNGLTLQGIAGNTSGYYALGSDINAAASAGWTDGSSTVIGFNPISSFEGDFNGLGHTVSSLTINRPGNDEVGLFGSLLENGRVANVGLTQVSIVGGSSVGGLVGQLQPGSFVANAYVSGSVSGSVSVGGLVGDNGGSIVNSHSSGTVSGSSQVGGLVGLNEINDSDFAYARVSHSYSTSSVTGSSDVGGLVGWGFSAGYVINSHYNIESATLNGAHPVTFGGLYNAQFQNWLGNGLALNISDYSASLPFVSGDYLISNVQGLKDLLGFADNPDYRFRLTADIDLASLPGFTIPLLRASQLSGDGHVISNLNLGLLNDYVGFIGYLGTGAEVTDLGVTGSVTGKNVVGGLVGANAGTVLNSDAAVTVSGGDTVGGLVGLNELNDHNSRFGTVGSSYATGSVTGTSAVGGLLGSGYSESRISNSHYNIEAATLNGGHQVTVGGLYDAQFQGWLANGRSLNISDYSSSLPLSGDYYLISNVQGLKDLLGFSEVSGYQFKLTSDIDLSSLPGFSIPVFRALALNGSGYAISNVSINLAADNVGFIGYLGMNAQVSMLGVTGAVVAGSGSVGGLVGYNAGSISGSYSALNAAAGSVSGGYAVGGLVGTNAGSINTSYSTVPVAGAGDVGGLVGANGDGASVTNSFANGSVSATGRYSSVGGLVGVNVGAIVTSYSSGSVSGPDNPGGLVGYSYWGSSVDRSYWDTTGSGLNSSAAGVGLTFAQTTQADNFTAWDFTNIWQNSSGLTAPTLRNINGVFWNTWTGSVNNSSWSTPGNWSLLHVPTALESVNIPDLVNTSQLVIDSGSYSVKQVRSAESVAVSGSDSALLLSNGGTFSAGLAVTAGATLTTNGALTVSGGLLLDSATITSSNSAGALTVTDIFYRNGGSLSNLASLSLTQLSGSLSPGAITGITGSVWLTASSGALLLDSISAGSLYGQSGGGNSITLNSGARLSTTASSGNGIVLNAGSGGFVNNSGSATPFSKAGDSSSRWLIYAASPSNVTKNGMTSSFRHYGVSTSTYAPGSVSETGNGFLYAASPTLSVTSSLTGSATHVYGDDPSAVVSSVLSGFADAEDNASNIGLSGTAVYSLPGATANVSSSYGVAYSSGLSSSSGYLFSAANSVAYSVTARQVTASISGSFTKEYDGTTLATLGSNYALANVVPADLASLGLGAASGVYSDKNVGTGLTVTFSGLSLTGASASNYHLVPASLTSGSGGITTRTLATWTGAAGDYSWKNPLNWASNVAPEASNVLNVVIPNGAGTILYDAIVPTSLLTLTSGSSVSLTGSSSLALGSSLSDVSTLNNSATFGVLSGTHTLNGILNTARFAQSGGTLTGAGILNLSGAGTSTLSGGTLSVLTHNLEGSTLNAVGNATITTLMTNAGTLKTGNSVTFEQTLLNSGGTVQIESGTTTLEAGFAQTSGNLRFQQGNLTGDIAIGGGTLTGSGSVTGNVAVSGGTLAVGYSPGALSINGNLVLGAGSVTTIELGGTQAGTQYDLISVSGTALLDGILNVIPYGSYVPTAGASYNFLVSQYTSGQFASVSLPVAWGITLGQGLGNFQLLMPGEAPTPTPSYWHLLQQVTEQRPDQWVTSPLATALAQVVATESSSGGDGSVLGQALSQTAANDGMNSSGNVRMGLKQCR